MSDQFQGKTALTLKPFHHFFGCGQFMWLQTGGLLGIKVWRLLSSMKNKMKSFYNFGKDKSWIIVKGRAQ